MITFCEIDVARGVSVLPSIDVEEFILDAGSVFNLIDVLLRCRLREGYVEGSCSFMRILKHLELVDVLFFLIN